MGHGQLWAVRILPLYSAGQGQTRAGEEKELQPWLGRGKSSELSS